MLRALRDSMADERGQASTEYVLLVVIVVIAALGAFKLFRDGIVGYYQRITMVVSLPIP
jgi:Flp pilus assembly pilin Flp